MEEKIRELCKKAMESLGKPLSEVIVSLIVESYYLGLQQASQWITVETIMPRHHQLVNAALYDSHKNSFSYYIGWYNKDTKQWYLNDYGYTESVTHWMPLPEIKPIEIKEQ